MTIQNSIAALEDVNGIYRVNVAISAGDVTFSVIGSDEARHFVIFGLPIEELKNAKKVSLPNDLVLSLSAWQHCTPSQYEYVIKDPYNVKIIKVLKQSDTKSTYMTPASSNDHVNPNHEMPAGGKFIIDAVRPSSPYRTHLISINGESYSETENANKKEKALTGMAYCGVIGHIVRRYYAIIGPPVDKAIKIMGISYDKVSCDYDTVLHSHFRKDQFRSRGVRTLQRLEKYHIYEYLGDIPMRKNLDATSSLDYCYPILGRLRELEYLDDILDEIGVIDRKYSGLLIEILEAEDCETVEEREKELLNKLGDVLALEDFCYLNVLMRLKTKVCILLDDIQYMDHRSWQFLSSALDNCNIVTAMTMPKPNSWDDLSHVEAEIYKDKRLTKHILLGLSVDLLPVFACQFLNVLAIPRKLSRLPIRILQRRKDGHIGWCEALLTSILQSNGLDFIKISPSEAAQRDLVFPNGTLVTKLPVDLTPEELAPPLPWSQMSLLDICVTNENYLKITGKDRDMTVHETSLQSYEIMLLEFCTNFFIGNCRSLELMSEIYDRMNPYEQDFIKCAATLGRVFKRSMIENVMINSIPLHTIKTVSEMIRMRILECASLQRRDFHTEDLIFCIDKKRQTFSDMHHSLSCNCHHSRAVIGHHPSPLYAHCKMLEFKVDSFYKMMYNIQTNEEKQEHHTRAAKIYGLDARKCSSCGSGHFLRIFSEDVLKEMEKEDIQHVEQTPRLSLIRRRTVIEGKWVSKPSLLSTRTTTAARKQGSVVCRVSIMPTTDDEDEEMTIDPSDPSYLEKFSHIDYRNCQCDNIISHLFWRLHLHIEKSGEIGKVLEFFIEYSAGVIQIAQPLYALKLLSIAAERSRAAEVDEWIDESAENSITDKGIILALMGDAHIALGNYDQAKKYYLSAVRLRGSLPRLEKGICYNVISKMFCKLQDYPRYTIDEESRGLIVKKFELASYLRRLCVVFMIDNKLKTAQSFALRSFKLAFLSVNNFLEKGEIYLATVRVLHCTRNIKLIRHIERPMLITIRRKGSWNNAEEIAMVANIYLTMYQIRVLRGELEEAVDMGIKVLKISATLHLNKLMLITVPSLIQIMLWTRRVNEAVDLMRELYFLADEDMDLSAKTWYYALSLDLMLDAGIILESYETSYNYYEKFIGKNCSAVCIDILEFI
ncbi:adenylate cyclase type 10-like [Temnothorax longispinosus]|uniref:adenylate cyclase type 10-like n=1 Tax=Temnothorax longispinosus TaxID=300112 RepID=UPI003A9905BA